ncbi:MAG TPA: hypothetical protein VFO98_04360 [Marmoricola sp.]|jgi:apolipoprotein N-acyltransferase|nr:hypothetical protein [Marmoricola sp.]
MSRFSIPDRVGAACATAYIVLILVGNGLASGGQNDPHPTGSADLADFAEHPGTIERLGFVMEVLGFVAFMFFLGWLVTTLRGRGGAWGWLSGVAGVAGTLALAIKLGSFLPMLAGYADHKDLTPGLARVLADMNSAGFVLFTFPYAVFMIGAAGSLLAAGYVGKVLGIGGIVVGAAGVLMPLPTQFDPVDSNVLPWILGMLWTLCLGIRLAWRGPRAATADADLVEPVAAMV